jgi:hypothetical protein
MNEINKLKTLMGAHGFIQEFDKLINSLGEDTQRKIMERVEFIGSPKFEGTVILAFQAEVGTDVFKTLAVSPAFKDLLDNFRSKFAQKYLTELFNFIDYEAKQLHIEHDLTADAFLAVIAITTQIRNQGFNSYWGK